MTFEEYLKSLGYDIRYHTDKYGNEKMLIRDLQNGTLLDESPLRTQWQAATQFSSPEVWGTSGATYFTSDPDFETKGGSWSGDGKLVTIDGKQYIRTGTDDQQALSSFDAYGGGYFKHPTFGWVVPLEVAEARTAASQGFFDKYGVALAGAGLAAGPMAASMAAGSAGTAFPTTSTAEAFGPAALDLSNMTMSVPTASAAETLGSSSLSAFGPSALDLSSMTMNIPTAELFPEAAAVTSGMPSLNPAVAPTGFFNPGTEGAISNLIAGTGATAPASSSLLQKLGELAMKASPTKILQALGGGEAGKSPAPFSTAQLGQLMNGMRPGEGPPRAPGASVGRPQAPQMQQIGTSAAPPARRTPSLGELIYGR